ncbi:MAG: hypothetical protein IJ111_08365 [Eggerthellaceae bacterium]|nr:hypothetical protein [Eggerthellaceae bacterium]
MAIVALLMCTACAASSNAGAIQSAATDVSNAARVAGTTAQIEGTSTSRVDGSYTAQTYDLDPDDMLSIPGSTDVVSINLSGGEPRSLSASQLADIKDAISSVEQLGDCGFVFLDVANGHGLAYNADQVMYVASAAKAPFIYHLVKTVPNLDEDERQNVEWTIVDSENEALETLFFDHLNDGYDEFMTGFDVYHEDYSVDFYPKMAARNLTAIWADILLYIRGGSEDAQWLADLFSSTETSFIRDGLSGTGAAVMNKAGWIVEQNYDYEYDDESEEESSLDDMVYKSVSDAAIIEADGRTYLMTIVTSQPDMGMTELNVSNLTRALFDQRSAF